MVKDNSENKSPRRSQALTEVRRAPLVVFPRFSASFEFRPWLVRSIALEIDQGRLFAALPVCFGAGILLFFLAEGSPSMWPAVFASTVFAGLAILSQARFGLFVPLVGIAVLFAGFSAAASRISALDGRVLSRPVITSMTGIVETVEERSQGLRLVIHVLAMERLSEQERPKRVRVTLKKGSAITPGQTVTALARLLPPPEPAFPGGYDFARDASFREIGAVGSLLGSVSIATEAEPRMEWWIKLSSTVDMARNALTRRIAMSIGGQAGAVAAALVTGKRGGIEDATNDVLRGAGIYHIVSISGLHMVLAAGTFFWLARALLALVPALALLWPIKKIAAAAAMGGAVAYCVFSGSEVATERSLIMTLVMLGAILVDRQALSIRNLGVSALIVLAREPESLLGPSFQMSFGAVAALIALAPSLRVLFAGPGSGSMVEKLLRKSLRGATGLVATTLVASFATAPFAAYHFQTVNPFGLIGNALALPLVSLVVMPAAVAGILALPFGLDAPIWQMMGWAVAKVLDVSAWVNAIPHATSFIPAWGSGVLLASSAALLLSTLMASSLKWLALLPAGIGLVLVANPERFDVVIDREGAGAAVRAGDGRLVILGKPSTFVTEQWLRADGDGRSSDDPTLRAGVHCDSAGCVTQARDGGFIAYVQTVAAYEEDCRRASIVISKVSAPAPCQAVLMLDKAALKEKGATTVRFAKDGAWVLRSTKSPTVEISLSVPKGSELRIPEPLRPARPTTDIPEPEDLVSSDERD